MSTTTEARAEASAEEEANAKPHIITRVVGFVAVATRRARRAAVNGTKAVYRGVLASLPFVVTAMVVMAGLAMLVGAVAVNVMFIMYLTSISPLLGLLAVCANIAFFGALFMNANRQRVAFVPA